jgi:hypothetical protein
MTRSLQFSVSKIINAPLSFVYRWCTDFREDDQKITDQRRRIRIHERTATRFIMSVRDRHGAKIVSAARIVTLKPPDSWHLDWIGDEYDEKGDYRLTKLGSRRTRFSATFKVASIKPGAPTKQEMRRNVTAVWDKYTRALEKDYASR